MEVIILIVIVLVVAFLWTNYVKTEKSNTDSAIDSWQPPKQVVSTEKEWPFGEKLPEGKIHVKPADLAVDSNQAAVSATTVAEVTAENKSKAAAKIKRAPAKKAAVKKVVAKAPRKPKSV
jgi:hypothetical protein